MQNPPVLPRIVLPFAILIIVLLFAGKLHANNPAFTGTVDYRYNALGQRTSKTVNGVTTYYLYGLNGERIAEVDQNGNVTREYLYLNGEPLAQVDGVNTEHEQIYYSHNDHLGAPLMMTDQNRNIVWQVERTPFGEIVEEDGSGATTQNRSFPGQYHDSETATDYNYYRDYDPALGRYLQSDPIGLIGGINTYGYVGGNPLVYIDPLGLTLEQASAALELVKSTQTDLNVPDHAAIAWWYGGRGAALTNPMTKNISVSRYFFKDLNCKDFELLVNRLIHESIHRTRPRSDMIMRPFEHQDIYDDARRRSKEIDDKIKRLCSCDKR